MKRRNKTFSKTCAICGNVTDQAILVGDTRICPDCVQLIGDVAHQLFEDRYLQDDESEFDIIDEEKDSTASEKSMPTPREIKSYVDQYMIGQDKAKIAICTAIYNHYKRIDQQETGDVEIEKSNILVCGPSGSGKSFLAKTVAKMLNVPFAVADATALTQAGYVGEDVETILTRLYQNADENVEATQRGIVFIDEIDKIARPGSANMSITRDVGGEGVQQALLKILEGSDVLITPTGGRKHPEGEMVKINTSNILFICGGAFDGISKIIEHRMHKKTATIGYGVAKQEKIDENTLLDYVTVDDFQTYGMIPELLGRLPIITNLKPLDKETLVHILTKPKNSIVKQYQKLLAIDGVSLKFTKEALDYIANKAMEKKLGARGLRSIVENIMLEPMYNLPSTEKKELKITLDFAKRQLIKANMETKTETKKKIA